MQQRDSIIEYQWDFFPIIWRKKGAKDGKTDPCPFCGRNHYHGMAEGHRVSHCPTGEARDFRIDGQVFKSEHGYYLKEY